MPDLVLLDRQDDIQDLLLVTGKWGNKYFLHWCPIIPSSSRIKRRQTSERRLKIWDCFGPVPTRNLLADILEEKRLRPSLSNQAFSRP